jgi:SAM-dependent methyltransferase
MIATINTRCRLCDGPIEVKLELGWTPLANALHTEPQKSVPMYPLALAECLDCGHVQLPIQVDPAELFPPTYPYASGATASMRAHLDEVAALLAEELPRGARVLEVGSNDGYLLDQMAERGLSVVGVDPAASPESIRRHAVIAETWGKQLNCLAVSDFDAVLGLNVFAHMQDLKGAVYQASRALKPGGLLMIEVGYFCSMVQQHVFDTIYHEHLDYHTLRALVPFLERFGFKVYDAQLIPTQGGSIRVWAQLGDYHRPDSPRIAAISWNEGSILHDWPKEIRPPNRVMCVPFPPLVGYGCPAKATTLTRALGMTVDAYIDDNPLKAGKYAPDGKTPIVAHTEELDARFSDGCSVVLFAWNMESEVMPKIRSSPAKCIREASVLVPFPEPHWVEP